MRKQISTTGRLEVICGPMFSGKTTELIRRVRESDPRFVIVFKPSFDTRYEADSIVTHSGEKLAAKAVGRADEILAAARGGDARTIAIDEAHFFGAPLAPACVALVNEGTRVIVAGLERDHRGQPFDPFPELLCEAEEVVKLSGACARCGGPAVHSQRMMDSPGRIVVGGAGAYEARCRRCFVPGA